MTIAAPKLAKITADINKLRQRTCDDVVEIGRLLSQARKLLDHGGWYKWLRREFTWSRQTADNFIHVYETFGGSKTLNFGVLESSALYELARPSTPAAARATVLKLIAAKTPPSLVDVKRIIRDAKPAPDAPKPAKGSVRQAALADQFRAAIAALLALSTKPSAIFANTVPADDLDMLSNFLRQVATASRKAVGSADAA